MPKYYLLAVSLLSCLGLLGMQNSFAQWVDPTQPTPEAADVVLNMDANGLVLNAVIYAPSYKSAVINGQVVQVGDKISEYIVMAINPEAVDLVPVKKGNAITLHVFNDTFKHLDLSSGYY